MSIKIRKNIPALTGVRGVAALVVLLFHIPLKTIFNLDSEIVIIRNGYYGVDLFFILSGLILYHVHENDFTKSIRTFWKSFIVSRLFRVFPLHLAVLGLIICYVILQPSFVLWFRSLPGQGNAYSLAGLLQTASLTNGFGGVPNFGHWNPPSWSLSAELIGYASFPFVAYSIGRCSLPKCFIVSAAALALYCLMRSGALGFSLTVLRMEFCFVAGVAISRAYHIWPENPFAPTLCWAGAILSVAFLAIDKVSYFSVLGFSLLLYGLSLGGGIIERFFESTLILYLGTISFSLYLVHFVLQSAILWNLFSGTGNTDNPYLASLLLVSAPIALAIAFYHLIEQPSHSAGRMISKRMKLLESQDSER